MLTTIYTDIFILSFFSINNLEKHNNKKQLKVGDRVGYDDDDKEEEKNMHYHNKHRGKKGKIELQ